MSTIKRHKEDMEGKEAIALRLAITEELLESCEHHGTYYDACATDLESVIEKVQDGFQNNSHLNSSFSSFDEFKEVLESIYHEHSGSDKCELCSERGL
ncbi:MULTISPECIES: hypothetical protein [Shewanella]|uniref:hypothetical protein n=1 Tax=Shewanella TaxID=22 RepID=UPI0006DB9DE5|nr:MULTISPECIES: hypothetical protein [Shewanella]KPN77355.1 hypothetical protein AEA42_08715 [Shewanella sp. Sh95]VEE61524.1 Uncharacterised protein [Shewanella putrefaciens]VEE61526.1 Uncharacterised protein [Shewanella putrefaciens]